MGSLVMTKEMPGTPEALFATITRPATWEQWFSIHRDFVHEPPDRLAEGATLASRVVMLGVGDEFEWTVEVLDEPYRIVLLGSGNTGLRSEFTYWLRPSERGTTLTIGGVFTGPQLTAARSATMERHGRAELERTLDQLATTVLAGRR